MSKEAPRSYRRFVERYPKLGEAWDAMRAAEESAGPLDDRTRRLLKLAVAVGACREGSVHSAARKAVGAGIAAEELEQVVALAASTIGMPATVAAHGWLRDVLDADDG